MGSTAGTVGIDAGGENVRPEGRGGLELKLCKIPSGNTEAKIKLKSLRAVSLKPEATASGGGSSLG